MEDPPKHNNKEKNNRKILNIGAGAGSFAGIGGFVLFGGAIVTATLVSAAFAFKNRRQKQSSSSTKTQTVDSPSDGVTSMKEMNSKTIHDSSQDEKHDSGTDNDEKVEAVNSNKDQDNTLNYVDSDLESEEADNSYEKIALDSERRVDGDEKVDKESLVACDVVTSMANVTVLPAIRSDGVTSMKEMESKTIHVSSLDEKHNSATDNDEKVETGDSNEDQDSAYANFVDSVLESKDADKSYGYLVLDSEPKDDGDAKVDTESLVSDETAKSIAEYDAFEEDQMAVEAEETMQYEKVIEAAQDEVPLGNNVSEASNEDIPNGHVDEDQETVLTNEEAEAAHVNLVKAVQSLKVEKENSEMVPEDMEDITEIADHEVAAVVHGTHEDEVSQTSVSNKPPTQSMNEETEQKVEARVTKDDELINNEEKDTEDEIRHLQVIDDQSVERQDNTLARFIDEEETSQNSEQQVATEDELINKDEKDTEGEEQHIQVTDDLPSKREHDTPIQLINKEEQVEKPIVTKDYLVKEEEQIHVQSIKEDEEAKDVTVRSQVTSEGTEKSTQEEPTKEAKIGNQNIEDKTEENKTVLGKEQNDSSHNGIEKEDKDSKSASTHVLDLSKGKIQALASKRWNLKLQTWSALVSVWCLFHWYSELPFPEVSLVCSLMFILIFLGYRNRTTNLVRYE